MQVLHVDNILLEAGTESSDHVISGARSAAPCIGTYLGTYLGTYVYVHVVVGRAVGTKHISSNMQFHDSKSP